MECFFSVSILNCQLISRSLLLTQMTQNFSRVLSKTITIPITMFKNWSDVPSLMNSLAAIGTFRTNHVTTRIAEKLCFVD